MHWLDALYLGVTRRQRLFEGGWGELSGPLDHVPMLMERSPARPLELEFLPTAARVEEAFVASPSPLLPPESSLLHVVKLKAQGELRGRVIAPPSWGDEGFGLRRHLLNALRYHGFEVWLFEGAYFGSRRASGQRGVGLRTVGDFLRMGLANVLEARVLAQTALERSPSVPTLLAGYSMAGQMAGHAAASLDAEVGVVAMAPSDEAGAVFCEGPLSKSVDFGALGPDSKQRLAELLGQLRVTRQSIPASRRRAVVVTSKDGIVPPAAMSAIARHWGVTPTSIETGHLGAYALHARALREVIVKLVE